MFKKHRQLLTNFASLSTVNLINLIAPLIIIPWLLHKLGVEAYGRVALHQYMGQFVLMLVDFGFPIYCVNEVAARADNRDALARFVGSVYLIKLCLAGVALLGLLVLATSPTLAQLAGLSPSLLAGFVAVGMISSFYPNWLFQGIERIHAMIIPTALSKIMALMLIFWLVDSPGDIWLVPLSYGIAGLMLNLTAAKLVLRETGGLSLLPTKEIWRIAVEASQVFWSRLIIMLYVACSPILVRTTAGEFGVAIYSLCEKAVSLGRMPFDMLANAAYPRLAREYHKSFSQRLFYMQTGVAAVVLLGIGVTFWLGKDYLRPSWANASGYLMLYLIALLPMSAHSFLGTCVLLVHGKRMQLSVSILVGLFAYFVTFGVGGWWFTDQIARVIMAMVMVEFGIFGSRYFFSRRFELI